MDWVEWFGYLASVIVAVSLTMRSIVRLRWWNLLGAACFSLYGFIIAALPVAFLNLFIVFANLYYLRAIYSAKDQFQLVEAQPDSPMVKHWLQQYHSDIVSYFPHFQTEQPSERLCWVLMRNQDAVGILIAEQQSQQLQIHLDYVFPAYRDFKTGAFLYQESGLFRSLGVSELLAKGEVKSHQQYLEKMGFTALPNQLYSMQLPS
ncbi:hypothetical protein [Aliagarivorans marinus]|uniref:hypothetical protein n=1 Tax=Aliagarivorans marinus TaxID=561965 RepID=UPI00041F3F85|nr:hypothetical protein [Aliagarivorans marinus]